MSKSLEYLDLELKHAQLKLTLDHMPYYCFAEGKHKHRFHTEDQQLNFVCDSLYLVLNNLHITKLIYFQTIDYFKAQSQKNAQKSKDIDSKLEYLKQQQEVLVNKEQRKENFVTLTELEQKVQKLEKQVQKLTEVVTKLL